MATININPPAKISRNTAADGDFLWKQDFEVLYNNDIALKNAIEQGAKELTPSSGINIDADKNISINKGKGLKFNGNALEVDIKGKGGANVTYEGDKIVVSGYDPTELIHNVSELEDSLDVFSESLEELEKEAITSADNMQPGTQYVYTTNGWEPIAGGGSQTISYWRPTYNSSTGKIEWEMQPSPSMVTPLPSDDLRGTPGENGKTPEFKIDTDNKWYWKYTDESEWTPTNVSATGPQGIQGEQGPQGWTPTITAEDDPTTSAVKVTIDWPAESHISDQVFYIPSGDKGDKGVPGDKGDPGDNGYTPSVSADDITDVNGRGKKITFYWPDGPEGKSDTEFNIYHGYSPTMALRAVTDPQGQHTEGGIEFTINYLDKGTSAVGTIWNGNNGTATVNCDGRWITGNGQAGNVIRPTTETLDTLQSVSGKVSPAAYDVDDDYFVWKYSNQPGAPSGWTSLKIAGVNEGWIEASDLDQFLKPENGLSGKWVGGNTQEYQFGLTSEYEDAIKDVSNKVDKSGDTMTGQLVVNTTTNHPFVGISQRGDSDDFAVFGATRKKGNNYGTTWLGVASNGDGVLKNIPDTSTSASTEPESNGAYTQITFGQNNNAVPSIDINAKLNGSNHNYKSVVVPQQSYNNMSAFDATNGPNYMLRKLNDGSFDIGACVINVTSIPETTEANTYYFVYDIV